MNPGVRSEVMESNGSNFRAVSKQIYDCHEPNARNMDCPKFRHVNITKKGIQLLGH